MELANLLMPEAIATRDISRGISTTVKESWNIKMEISTKGLSKMVIFLGQECLFILMENINEEILLTNN
jgi:hypothetical protein